jgi:hypothetical protein
LFGNRDKSKGFFNYSLLLMVYVELKLERKVGWSTFPTTMQYPLLIGKLQKHIPDMYNPELAMTKGILDFLSKKLQGASGGGSTSKKEATPKVVQVGETSNPLPQNLELMVQNPLLRAAIPSLEQDFGVGMKNPTELVDAVIATVVCRDLSLHNALPTLENPTHITYVVAKDGINVQPRFEDVQKEKENLCQSTAVSNLVDLLEYPGPSNVAPIL